MATKHEQLPSVDDDLALPTEPQTPRPNLAALKSGVDIPDEAVRANSRSIGEKWGATTRITAAPPATPLESLRIDVPDYLARELRVRCAEQKVTNAYIVMKALAKEGFHIEEKDLVTDRYKRGKR
jgi:hypothetical protein